MSERNLPLARNALFETAEFLHKTLTFAVGAVIGSWASPVFATAELAKGNGVNDIVRREIQRHAARDGYSPTTTRSLDRAYVAGRTLGQLTVATGSAYLAMYR